MTQIATPRRDRAGRLSGFVRLHGPLAGDSTAKILHALLLGLLVWTAIQGSIGLLFFVAKPGPSAAVVGFQAISYLIALAMLERGNLRSASLVYLFGVSVPATVVIALNGGTLSPALVLFVSIPISAAWLLGFWAALVSSAFCLLVTLAMAVAARMGVQIPPYFPGTPLGGWSMLLESTIIAALPVMVVLRTLNESLDAAQGWIKELRETQEALRRERDLVHRIMETSPVGIIAVNRDGKLSFVNSSGERIFGLSRDEITRRAYNDVAWNATSHDGTPYPDEEHPFRQVQLHGATLNDVRLAIVRPDKRRVLLSVNAAPVWTADGKFDGMVASLEDVTERARVEGELRRYREELEEVVRQRTEELVVARDQAMAANKAKNIFLANVSHELRTPLNAILGFATLLADDEGVGAAHLPKLRTIKESGEHLLELIDDVLDMAKIEAGGVSLGCAPTDLNDLVSGVVETMRVRAREKRLILTVEQTSAFPRFARTDSGKVRQILINLVSNAIKYTEHGHVILRLDAEKTGRWLLKVEVADTGIGIASDDQERIFRPFVQLENGHSGGTGLGLSLTRQYVEIMGGTITVESAPGQGSVFRVSLPAEVAETVETDREAPRVIGLAPGQPRFRILIVEDDEENRNLVAELLKRSGFQVKSVGDGAAAVRAFRSWQPHFIWMDWRLPLMDGEQATKAIRVMAAGRRVKIAAVAASASSEERAAILAAGVDEFVRKPFRPQHVFECMTRLLGVRYIYDERWIPAQVNGEAVLTPETLRVLPERLRQELGDAVISLDVNRVTGAIRRAYDLDREIGAALSRHANSLGFTAILKALEASREREGKEAR